MHEEIRSIYMVTQENDREVRYLPDVGVSIDGGSDGGWMVAEISGVCRFG